jgi:hypothetical protein
MVSRSRALAQEKTVLAIALPITAATSSQPSRWVCQNWPLMPYLA